jgi:hypothetical protein
MAPVREFLLEDRLACAYSHLRLLESGSFAADFLAQAMALAVKEKK